MAAFTVGDSFIGSASSVGGDGVVTGSPPAITGRPAAIKAEVYNSTFTTLLGELDKGFGKSFQKTANDVGAGTFSLGSEDVDTSLLGGRNIIKYSVYDPYSATYTAALAVRHDADKHVVVSSTEEIGEMYTVSGKSIIGDFERSCVAPPRGFNHVPFSDIRKMGYMSPEFDDSSWANAVVRGVQKSATGAMGLGGFPFSYPNPGGTWISIDTPSGPTDSDAPGVSFYRKTFTIASDEIISIYATADDGFRLYLDGVDIMHSLSPEKVFNSAGFTFAIRLRLSAGTYTLAAEVENYTSSHVPNIELFICDVYKLVTFGSYQVEQHIFGTDATWKMLAHPADRPGMNPGQVMEILVDEAQARSAKELESWSYTMSNTADSAGVAWAYNSEWEFQVGQSYLEVLKQLSKGYCDFEASPSDLELRMYNPEGGGADLSATVKLQSQRDIVDVSQQSTVTDFTITNDYGAIVNALLVRWAYGWFEVEVGSSVTAYGKTQKPLSLTDVTDAAKALSIANDELNQLWERSMQADVKFLPITTLTTPFKSYDVWDTISLPLEAGGSFDTQKVVSLTCSETDNGDLDVQASFISMRSSALIRLQRLTERMNRGALAGKSDSATPITPFQSQFSVLEFEPISFVLPVDGSQPEVDVLDESGSTPNFRQRRINAAWISGKTTSDTTNPNVATKIDIFYNGTLLGTVQLAAGEIFGNVAGLDGYMVNAGILTVGVQQLGRHTDITVDVYTSNVIGDMIFED